MSDRIVITTSPQLGLAERALSVILGLGLAAVAARPRPNMALSAIALAAGSYLAWRGATGRDPLNVAISPASPRPGRAAVRRSSRRRTAR